MTWVGVAGFEPAASSSRSQVPVRPTSAVACLTCDRSSVCVRWRPPLSVAIVTHFVTRALASRSPATADPNTLSKSARPGPGPAKVKRVRDLGHPFWVVSAEHLRTYLNETGNETRAAIVSIVVFCSLCAGDGEDQESVRQQMIGVADDRGAAPGPR
jgi:hypothetical protein